LTLLAAQPALALDKAAWQLGDRANIVLTGTLANAQQSRQTTRRLCCPRCSKSAGFDTVESKLNLTGAILRKDAARLSATRAGTPDVAVVYYAGHGIELEWHHYYLIPISMRRSSRLDADGSGRNAAA
jgi:hypothetical protein